MTQKQKRVSATGLKMGFALDWLSPEKDVEYTAEPDNAELLHFSPTVKRTSKPMSGLLLFGMVIDACEATLPRGMSQ